MPLKLELNVGDDRFLAEGDFQIQEAVDAVKEWGRLVGLAPGQEEVDALTSRLKKSTDTLKSTVDAHPSTT